MGRLDHAASRVHSHAVQVLHNTAHTYPPPWLATIQTTPPSQKLVRPILRRTAKPGKRSSRLFQPVNLTYEEDKLRWEYFNDHPWELARPRVVLENDGRDREKWDWSVELDVSLNVPRKGQKDARGRTVEDWERMMASQSARPLNGESVVRRQHYLLTNTNLTAPAAYDTARKELYRIRHAREVERRIAKEEALSVGSHFGLGPLEIGMKLEDGAYEHWKAWAIQEVAALKQLQGSAYSGVGTEEAENEMAPEVKEEEGDAVLQEISGKLPATKRGLEAKGGAVVHP